MSYKTFEIINGELFINEPLLPKQTRDIRADWMKGAEQDSEDYTDFATDLGQYDEPEYGSDLIDIGDD